jgi:adenosylcobinamide kinase/adenosylcobinamide-phosphate guanylyltransferase
MIYYITGGERSGKSQYAQKLALELTDRPIYIATARHWDEDFEKRITRHQEERDARWTSLEEEKHLHVLEIENRVAVIDCVTLWLTNYYVDTKYDLALSLSQAKAEIELLCKMNTTLLIISNEIGMGVHAETEIGRKFVELQGWINQFIAERADKAVLMVSGIPLQLK